MIRALELDRPGRDGRDERFLEAPAPQGRLEVGEIGLDRRRAAIADRRGAHRVRHRGGAALHAALDLAVGIRETLSVTASGGAATAPGQVVAYLEAGQTIGD